MSGRLRRSSTDVALGGVCAGIAEHYGWSANSVRVVFVLVALLLAAVPGILIYIVLWILLPR